MSSIGSTTTRVTDQLEFAYQISKATNIDPRVVLSWMQQEGAFSGKEKGAYNYLNIMGSSGPISFNSLNEGIAATIKVLSQPNMKPILATAQTKPTPGQQIRAIASTGWDASHYGGNGGVNLQNTFESMWGKGSLTSPWKAPSNAKVTQSTVGNDIARHIPGVAQAEDLYSAFHNGDWTRFLWIIGGGILVILGIILLFKSQSGSNTFTFARGE